jgi:hypothetical protein
VSKATRKIAMLEKRTMAKNPKRPEIQKTATKKTRIRPGPHQASGPMQEAGLDAGQREIFLHSREETPLCRTAQGSGLLKAAQ